MVISDAGSSDDYVAFDDGISELSASEFEDFQSLDIGVESLSLDDSLHLDDLPNKDEQGPSEQKQQRGKEEVESDASAFMIRVIPPSDALSEMHPIDGAEIILGRDFPSTTLASDAFLSVQHCKLRLVGPSLRVKDLESFNGTWIRLVGEQRLTEGDQIRFGQQRFIVSKEEHLYGEGVDADGTKPLGWTGLSSGWFLSADVGHCANRACHPIPQSGLRVGRLSGNLVFEDDQWLEGIHAVFSFVDGQLVVRDLTSLRGTWRLLQSEESFPPGTELLVGTHRVILEL